MQALHCAGITLHDLPQDSDDSDVKADAAPKHAGVGILPQEPNGPGNNEVEDSDAPESGSDGVESEEAATSESGHNMDVCQTTAKVPSGTAHDPAQIQAQ